MECEICGRPITGRKFKIIVEGSELTVCESCKDYGVEKPRDVKPVRTEKFVRISRESEYDYELLEDFHLIIKRERERRGWSQKELAKRIQEKESLIRKIENAEITPELDVIEKLERIFNIKLRCKREEVKFKREKIDLTPTLGDIVVIKKKKSNQ